MSTDARPSILVHATEEVLEEYSFGRIGEPQLGWLEEHLFICPECQSTLENIDEYKVFMKAGLASFEEERQAAAGPVGSIIRPDSLSGRSPSPRIALWPGFALRPLPFNVGVLTAAFFLVLAGAAILSRIRPSGTGTPIAIVKLIAMRGGGGEGDGGGGSGSVAHAPSGRQLDLILAQTDLTADLAYRAEVVDSSGLQMWSGNVRTADQNLSIRVGRTLRAGAYWVRLYSSAGQLLREFGLSVE